MRPTGPTPRAIAIVGWVQSTFGDHGMDPEERATRVLEEAIELAHAFHVEPEVMHKLIERTTNQPKGNPMMELAQLGLTTEALTTIMRCDLDNLIAKEWEHLQRIGPTPIQESAERKFKAGLCHRRKTGRTSAQIMAAPQGARFVVTGGMAKSYTRDLMNFLGRKDLLMATPADLTSGNFRTDSRPIVIDHGATLTTEEWEALTYIRARQGAPI